MRTQNGIQVSFISILLGMLSLHSSSRADTWIPGGAEDPKAFNASWHPTQYLHRFDQLPLQGSVENEHIPWADSYWPIQLGGMGYRWMDHHDSNVQIPQTSEERKRVFFEIHRYTKEELLALSPEARRKIITNLSPLEKFSIFKGDYNYSLVDHFQKDSDPSISYWQGYCHAWAPVSLHYPEPAPVVRTNPDGIEIPFGSADVKAVMIASYADRVKVSLNNFLDGFGRRVGNILKKIAGAPSQDKDAVYVGKRCGKRFMYPTTKIVNGQEQFTDYSDTNGMTNDDYIKSLGWFQEKAIALNYHPDGGPDPRNPDFINQVIQNMNDPSCSDVNAGAFHIIIANQLGIMKEGFQFDKTRDVEVWNQPAFRFDSSIVKWLNPDQSSTPGTEQVVQIKTRIYYADDTDYGWAFWFPTLPSLFSPDSNLMSEYDKYQKLLVNQGDIEKPGQYPEGIIDSSDYEYTLDLDSKKQIIGGSWISFDRPDFLWLFKKTQFTGEYKELNQVYEPIQLPDNQQQPKL